MRGVSVLQIVSLALGCVPGAFASEGGGHPDGGIPVSVWLNAILLLPLLAILFPKILAMFGVAPKERRDRLQQAVQEAEELRSRVEQMVREYEQRLAGLDREINQILEEARSEGEKEQQRILERAQRMAEKIREDALRMAEKELERSKRKLRHEFAVQATAQAAEALKKLVTEKEHQVFLHGLMERLEESDGQRR
ncbi:MAG TPA: ATP synthase F0 subunit B [Bdellovibrionota bacterium]|nr:ATP synthase F0 subunit B [Bdellovibrionota bacterium]